MISRSWKHISGQWDTCRNHLAISVRFKPILISLTNFLFNIYCFTPLRKQDKPYTNCSQWSMQVRLEPASIHMCFGSSTTCTVSQMLTCLTLKVASHDNWCTGTLWNRIITEQCEGMGEVGLAMYKPALLPPCPSIRVLCHSNCQRSTHSSSRSWQFKKC